MSALPSAERTSAGVAPDRQKIMVKGGMLKDDADWGALGIKPGQKLMMMGSAGAAGHSAVSSVEVVVRAREARGC
jgi:hypothetical protein